LLVRLWPNETTPRPRSTMPRLVEPRASGTSDPGSGGGGSVPKTIVLDEAGRVPGSSAQQVGGDASQAWSRARKYWLLGGAALVAAAAVIAFGLGRWGSAATVASSPIEPPRGLEGERSGEVLLPPPDALQRNDPVEPASNASSLPAAPVAPVATPPSRASTTPAGTEGHGTTSGRPTEPAKPLSRRDAARPSSTSRPRKAPSAQTSESGEPASVEITATPWAYIFVDDHQAGFTPKIVTISPGRHRFRAEREGYAPAEQAYVLKPGDQRRWNPQLHRASPNGP